MKSRNGTRLGKAMVLLLALLCGCTGSVTDLESEQATPAALDRADWDEVQGQPVHLYTLSAGEITARITNYGTTLTELHWPDREGHTVDVVLGFDSLQPYLPRHPYFGCIVGRVANRIDRGRFLLDGQEYSLSPAFTIWGAKTASFNLCNSL